MSRRAKMILVGLTALNAIVLAISISLPTRAAVGGKTYQDLVTDPDFTRAVQSVVQNAGSTSILPR
jgi:hypothetical protein